MPALVGCDLGIDPGIVAETGMGSPQHLKIPPLKPDGLGLPGRIERARGVALDVKRSIKGQSGAGGNSFHGDGARCGVLAPPDQVRVRLPGAHRWASCFPHNRSWESRAGWG
jgi:hypothetical protein